MPSSMSRASATGGSPMVTILPTMRTLPASGAAADAGALGLGVVLTTVGEGGVLVSDTHPPMASTPTSATTNRARRPNRPSRTGPSARDDRSGWTGHQRGVSG